jgi:hypothetical protein
MRTALLPVMVCSVVCLSAFSQERGRPETELANLLSTSVSRQTKQPSEPVAASPLRLVALLQHDNALAGIHDVQVQGNHAYVTGKGPEGTIVSGKGSFAIIDITDPRHPFIASSITTGLTNGETVLLDGDVCHVGSHHFWSVDISDKSKPKVLAKLEEAAIQSINGMVRLGGYLYAASKRNHVTVFDVRNPKAPRLAFAHRTAGPFRSPHDIDRLDDERIVVVNIDAQRGQDQLRVYKAANPRTGEPLPQDKWILEGAVADPRLTGANRVRVKNGVALVMCNKGYAVAAVDLRNPAKPVLTDWYSTADKPRYKSCGMDISGDVMIAAGSGVIGLFGISDLPRLKKLGEYEFQDPLPGRDVTYRHEQVVVRLQYLVSPDHDLVYRNGFLYTSDQDQNAFAVYEVVDPDIRRLLDK